MATRFTWLLPLFAVSFLCGGASAQMRGHRGSSISVRHTSNLNDTSNLQTAFPVPGFGFDFVHLAAVNPGAFNVSVLRSSQFVPFIPVALPFFSQPAQIIIVQQPPVVIVQTPPAVQESVEWPPRARAVQREEVREPERVPDPPRELEEIILIRRDGTLLFAVAFSTTGGQLTYVTREGLRRSLPLSEIDVDTTRRWNEERGTSLHLPS